MASLVMAVFFARDVAIQMVGPVSIAAFIALRDLEKNAEARGGNGRRRNNARRLRYNPTRRAPVQLARHRNCDQRRVDFDEASWLA
jgi:hypothetical protein